MYTVTIEQDLPLVAAGVAFFSLFAMFPGLAAVIALCGLIADPVVVESQLNSLNGFVPSSAMELLESQVHRLIAARSDALGWSALLSLSVSIWSSRAGIASLIKVLNNVLGRRQRNGIVEILTALTVTAALFGVSLAALVVVIIVPILLSVLPLGALAGLALTVANFVVFLGVLLLALGVVYRFGPSRRGDRLPWITPGAVVALLLWALISVAFSIYLSNFGRYNEVYGSIGAVIALMMWLYLTAFSVLVGAAINAGLERYEKPLKRGTAEKKLASAEAMLVKAEKDVQQAAMALKRAEEAEGVTPTEDVMREAEGDMSRGSE